MTRHLYRLGGAAAAHPWRTLAAWLVLLATAVALAAGVGGSPKDDYTVPDARAQVGLDLLTERFPAAAGAQDRVVVHDDAPLAAADLEALSARLTAMPHVASVAPPRTSDDGRTALLAVAYDVPVTHPDLYGDTSALLDAVGPARDAGLTVALGGAVPDSASLEASGTGEVAGVVVALVLLVLTFGSVVAAGLPVLVALGGLGLGLAGTTLLAAVMDVSSSAPTVATMVGLGVGIDYAMLLVTRHVEQLEAGRPVVEAAARSTATAGRSVVFAGATVLVSLLGLRLAGLPVYASFGVATALAVLAAMAAALTLVPAALGLAGRRVLPRRVLRASAHARPVRASVPVTARWAETVGRRPLRYALAGTAVMLALAAPVLDLRLWPTAVGAQPAEATTRQAYDLAAAAFGPGVNAPMLLVADLDRVPAAALTGVVERVRATDGVAVVGPVVTDPAATVAFVSLEPTGEPSDPATSRLVDRLRADVLPDGVELTGEAPMFADINAMLAQRIWLVVGFVVGVSMLLLLVMFRSVLVPLKAAAMNLLSVGAAYGVLVAVFQWGWGAGLLGLDTTVPVSSWVPVLVFAVAFGLSMDYEVFLLSRIREEWLRTGDARTGVVDGLACTGRLISAAAAIMVAVFAGFATEGDVVVKMIGVGLAAAVLVDATVVRLVLVPATMALLGRLNWWLPEWLDRLLPHLDAEVHDDDVVPGRPVPVPSA